LVLRFKSLLRVDPWGSLGESEDTIYQDFLPPAEPPDVESVAVHQLMPIRESDAQLFPEM
jgi:hypothetical protein